MWMFPYFLDFRLHFVITLICFITWKGSFSRENVLPRARMQILVRCVASLRESSREAMHFLAHSGALSRAKLETNVLSCARNRGYLGLSDESSEVGFGHPFGFCTFLVQNRFSKGFKIYRLSIRFLILKIYFNICDESFEIGFRPPRDRIKILGISGLQKSRLSQISGL